METVARILGSTIWIALAFVAGHMLGYSAGRNAGMRNGIDAVMCVMDRITESHGARGKSDYCKRVDRERDKR